MRWLAWVLVLAVVATSSGCGFVRNLRRDLEDEDAVQSTKDDLAYYRDPANRFAPLPPANVSDTRTAVLSGTPLDLSGLRAKNLRVKAEDFIAESAKNENSLWTDEGQANYLFARNKNKTPGDLVTIAIDDRLRRDMVDSVRKLLPPEYRDVDIRVPGLTKEKSASDQRAPASQAAAATNSGPTPEDFLTAEVLERYPNGNLRIRGIKRVPFKRQVRNIEVSAIVRGADVDEQDVINSSKFFEHKVELYR